MGDERAAFALEPGSDAPELCVSAECGSLFRASGRVTANTAATTPKPTMSSVNKVLRVMCASQHNEHEMMSLSRECND